MNEDMSDLLNKFKSMVDNDTLPDNLKEVLSSFNNKNSDNSSSKFSSEDLNDVLKNFTSNGESTDNSSIDIETLLKMKNIMEKLNSNKNDPKSNLLLSLKPYLRESRKSKVDQYMKFFNISKVIDVLNPLGGENKK